MTTYDRTRDRERLKAQYTRVRVVMLDHEWHTLPELSSATGDPEASVSARIRELRKRGHTIDKQYVARGLWEYRMAQPDEQLQLGVA
jgi:biotin operon repressor